MAADFRRRDRGGALLEYAAVCALAAVLAGALFAAMPGMGPRLGEHLRAAACAALAGADCGPPGAETAQEGRPAASQGPSQDTGGEESNGGGSPVFLWSPDSPEAEDCPPNEFGGCGPPSRSEHLADQDERPAEHGEGCAASGSWHSEGHCDDFFEIDMNWRGANIYIYESATGAIVDLVQPVCSQLAGGDAERTGECILTFLANLEGVPSSTADDWGSITDLDRADDITGAIGDIEEDGGCLTISRTVSVFGATNWTSRGSDSDHCRPGEELLGGEAAQVVEELPDDYDLDLLRGLLVDGTFDDVLPDPQREDLEDLRRSLNEVLDLDQAFEDLDSLLH